MEDKVQKFDERLDVYFFLNYITFIYIIYKNLEKQNPILEKVE